MRGEHFPQRGTDLAAAPAVAVSVAVSWPEPVAVVVG